MPPGPIGDVNEPLSYCSCELIQLIIMSQSFCIYSVESSRSDLNKLPVLPTRVLREHPSLVYW